MMSDSVSVSRGGRERRPTSDVRHVPGSGTSVVKLRLSLTTLAYDSRLTVTDHHSWTGDWLVSAGTFTRSATVTDRQPVDHT